MDNLMIDPLIRGETGDGRRVTLSLPGVIAGLMNDTLVSFPALQPHQRHAWHAFLTQLAAIAIQRAGVKKPPLDEPSWRHLLRTLTTDWPGDEPWRLVVEDLAQPAFMQPAVPEKNLKGFKNIITSPDSLDVLVTAKNHDIKMARIGHPRPDHWIMALITLQTMEGYSGRDNYGIARMNGGVTSRPAVGARPGPLPAPHFRRDLDLLRFRRESLLQHYAALYQPEQGLALLWLSPWDGQTELSLEKLDPYFIEVCRRIRLSAGMAGPIAHATTSKTTRIHAEELKGVLGDPWTPIHIGQENVSLTIKKDGFGYVLTTELLLGSDSYRRAPAQETDFGTPSDHTEFFAQALAREKGKTEGYHERRIPLPAIVRAAIGKSQSRSSLAAVANARVAQAGLMAKKVLKPAILTIIQRAPDKLNFKDKRVDVWQRRFDQRVDAVFFPDLWETLKQEPEQATANWIDRLAGFGRDLLQAAEGSLSGGDARHHKVAVTAMRVYQGALRNQFPDHFARKIENANKETT